MAVHGKNTHFELDNASGTLVDLSAYLTNVDFPDETDLPETTTYGSTSRTYTVGLAGATISLSGLFDTTLDAHMTALKAALRAGTLASASFVYGPAGDTSTYPKRTGECLVGNYSISDPVDGLVEVSIELTVTGDVTYGTFA